MPESAAEIHARVLAVASDGRLPAPSIAEWEIFPWEVVDGAIAPKALAVPGVEEPRMGDEGGAPCDACAGFDPESIIWEDERWVLTTRPASGLPLVLVLSTREHEDAGEIDDDLASEFGRISNRLVRIIESLPGIGRAHVNRWGDGSSHFHVWFFARPAGFSVIKGSYAVEWDEILPPVDADVRRADLHAVAVKLANWGGHARA
jgi:diadenosine tetraphosphate (Ap4A) HIT family hydrolase